MKELLRTNDIVRISWLISLLADNGVEAVVLDGHTSLAEGSISAIQRRLMVYADDFGRARRVLAEFGELKDA
jgi:hypothetical protein